MHGEQLIYEVVTYLPMILLSLAHTADVCRLFVAGHENLLCSGYTQTKDCCR